MPYGMIHFVIDISIGLFALGLLLFFFSSRVRKSDYWRATVTPLASIIGSGFLVIAPLLWILVGYNAIWVLLGVVLVAYAIGYVVRYNIMFVEPFLLKEKQSVYFKGLNDLSYFVLGISYFISVAFYVRILSAFALRGINIEDAFFANVLTTVILFSVGLIGYFRGFTWLESLELYSVNIKVSIIFMFILGLFLYDWLALDFHYIVAEKKTVFSFETLRKIFGILLIIQGFEISRYMGHNYHAEMRVKSMRLAQILSGLIYAVFIFLIMFLMGEDQKVTETAIIDLSQNVSLLLPVAITLGAVFSQFSAAVADTVGCGGIVTEYTRNRIPQNTAYLFITLCAILLIWVSDIFQIISIASRAFAAYYCTQCLQAIYITYFYHRLEKQGHILFFSTVGILMFVIAIFGIAAE